MSKAKWEKAIDDTPASGAATQTSELQEPGANPEEQLYGYQPTSGAPGILRQPDRPVAAPKSDQVVPAAEADEILDMCQAVARRARDAFRESCEAEDPDQADTSYLAAKAKLEELRGYAYLRDRAFRDLLMLVVAAVKTAELSQFTPTQKDVLRQAFADLPRTFLDDAVVEQHIDRFADNRLDAVLNPIRPQNGKRLKITIQVVEDDADSGRNAEVG